MNNQPRPILHEVIGVYILSFILDGPNWMIFDVQVLDSCFLNESFILSWKNIQLCDHMNDSFVNTENCWSYTEKTEFIEVSASIWFILILLQCVFVKIIPAIAIVTMNIMIIIKVIQ